MKETDIKKNNQKAVVQIERSEIQKKMEIYRKEEEKEKQAADEKRIKIFEMMQQNIQNHKINQENKALADKAVDHLVNPKEYV